MVFCELRGIDVPRHCGLCFGKTASEKKFHEGVEKLREHGKKFL